ncbi:hypothetical protein HYT00_01280 [Candidatus Giovannonibacteria bacterium]|nr:hypothetical protein [Candidatus Giovannonibacteria bacterium]
MPHNIEKAIIGVLIVIILAMGGYFIYVNRAQAPADENNSAQNAPTPTPSVNETAGWKTYQNKEFGFEFKYPDDWKVEDMTYCTAANVCGSVGTILKPNAVNLDPVKDRIEWGGRQFTCELAGKVTRCLSDEKEYMHTYSKNSEVLKIFDKIAETVKVTN